MKKKLIVLVLALAMLCVSLTACGDKGGIAKTNKIKIDNYAVALADTDYTEQSAYTTVTEISGGYIGAGSSYSPSYNSYGIASVTVPKTEGSPKYKLYNVNTKSYVSATEYDSIVISDSYDGGFITVTSISDSTTTKTLLDPTGTKTILPAKEYDDYINVTKMSLYVSGATERSTVYQIEYTEKDADKESYKYYVDNAKEDAEYPDLSEVAESEVSEYPQTAAGTVISSVTAYPVYDEDEEVGDMKAYTYAVRLLENGREYTFYKDGSESGKVVVKNGEELGFMENYMYYVEEEILPHDAKKGYNVYMLTSSSYTAAVKKNVTYYKYDIVKNKTSKFNPGYYIFDDIYPFYNRVDKKYDAAAVLAVPFVDGVAVVNGTADIRTYIVDKDFKVGYDLSDTPYSVEEVIKLKDDRYLLVGESRYIVNGKMETIASFNGSFNVYPDSQLITVYANNVYGAIDFDGKVVLEPKYSRLNFVGGVALADVNVSVTETKEKCLVSVSNKNGTEIESMLKKAAADSGESDEVWADTSRAGILVKRNPNNGKYTVYNYAGTEIKSFENVTNFNITPVGKALTIRVTTSDGTTNTTSGYVIA